MKNNNNNNNNNINNSCNNKYPAPESPYELCRVLYSIVYYKIVHST